MKRMKSINICWGDNTLRYVYIHGKSNPTSIGELILHIGILLYQKTKAYKFELSYIILIYQYFYSFSI